MEEKIRTIGKDIHSTVSGAPPAFDVKTWIGRIVQWSMKHEDFKLGLFRFIDVLPSLKGDALAVKTLNEYFSAETGASRILRGGIGLLGGKGAVPRVAGPLIRKSMESFARQFIAGRDPADAFERLGALYAEGTGFSIDLLGEEVVSDREARDCSARYLELLAALRQRFPGAAGTDVSVKVSSFYSQLDPVDWEGSIERTKEGLRPLLRAARDLEISVTFDMEHSYLKDLIIAIFKSLLEEDEFSARPSMGLALQTYLRDAERDLIELVRWARKNGRFIGIRLVKGAYWDYETVIHRQKEWPLPVYLSKEETDFSFERLTRLLFENAETVRPAVATHNLRSLSSAIALADTMKLSRRAFEFQMLYGMAEPLRKAVQERGFAMRVYAPVGKLIPGMAYLVRRLLENTSNESFLRKAFGEKASFEDLIKAPHARQEGPADEPSDRRFRNEPLLDFSISDNRKGMRDALRVVKNKTPVECPLYIGAGEVRTERETLSLNPSSPSAVVGRISSASTQHADAAIAEALAAREQWGSTAPEARADCLFRAAAAMRKRRFELAALEVLEVGKTWKDADGDVCEAVDYLEYYGREMLRLGSPRTLGDYPGEENAYRYAPKGVGAVISPWNFPLAIATGMTAAALVAGNCVIFKPSGLSPVTGFRLHELFRSAGLPAGALQFLPGPGNKIGEYLVSHPSIDFVAFTGSRDVGLRIVRLAGETATGQRNVKKVIAELGGKNAIIVDETADLDEAVKGILESAFGYQGQRCSACSRVIIVGAVFAELCGRLKEAALSVRVGPPEEPGVFMGPVIDEAALEKIKGYVELGKREGTTLLERGVGGEGYFVGPVIVSLADPRSRIATEEIFGPVLAVLNAKDMDEAIGWANDSPYALTGGLYSRSPENIRKVKEKFRVGNLYINRKITGALVGRQPFGGSGMSGTGSKAGGPDYLLQFMNPVAISENTMRRGFAPRREGERRG